MLYFMCFFNIIFAAPQYMQNSLNLMYKVKYVHTTIPHKNISIIFMVLILA